MQSSSSGRGVPVLFASTIFLSAFLLFQVQPLLGKFILPWFGGSPAVWTTCMLVFQVLLFAGYAYAHIISTRLTPRWQAAVHAVVLLAACAMLPIAPDPSWKPEAHNSPVGRIILLAFCTVGLPYFALSATGPLLQGWFCRTQPGRSPYRLYALSNLGSLLALVTYPFVFEPMWATQSQAVNWSLAFGLFAILCGACAWCARQLSTTTDRETEIAGLSTVESLSSDTQPLRDQWALWFVLAMLPSVLLLAVTNQVCLDVAVIPFLWVLPLALYLVSFILTFDAPGWYSRKWYAGGAVLTMALTCIVMLRPPSGGLLWQLVIYFGALFCACMVCHGELVRLKPHPRHLTEYYLTISAGGAAGGLSVGLLAPVLFKGYFELHLAFVGFVLAYLAIQRREETLIALPPRRWLHRAGNAGVLCGVVMLMTLLGSSEGAIAVTRNFYGVLRVRDRDAHDQKFHRRELVHGRIVHGSQFLSTAKRNLPTTYYGHASGVGRLLLQDASPSRRVGVIGLGIGSLAAYARPGDVYRFYEINPDVIRLAREHFTCLSDCAGQIELVEGDARLLLEHENSQQFDVLVLDAFSGDAIPVHLLTREAWNVYRRHLKPDGVLACHISNLHFDLRPVLSGLASQWDWHTRVLVSPAAPRLGTQTAHWCLMSPEARQINEIIPTSEMTMGTRRILWTDDRSNLFEVLR